MLLFYLIVWAVVLFLLLRLMFALGFIEDTGKTCRNCGMSTYTVFGRCEVCGAKPAANKDQP